MQHPELIIRQALEDEFEDFMVLYRQLQPHDPVLTDGSDRQVYRDILKREGLYLFVGELSGALVASIYLNLIPNITRSAAPYAVIENVITREDLRGQGLGQQMMAHVLEFAWRNGCYKAMLQTGSKRASTHAFYEACGFSRDEKTGYLARPPT